MLLVFLEIQNINRENLLKECKEYQEYIGHWEMHNNLNINSS